MNRRPWLNALGFAAAMILALSFIDWTDSAPEFEAEYLEYQP